MLQLKTTKYSFHVEFGVPGFNASTLIVRNMGICTKQETGVTFAGFALQEEHYPCGSNCCVGWPNDG